MPFVSAVSIPSEEKAFLSLLKCVQRNAGDNEGLALLFESCEPLVEKALRRDLTWRNYNFCLSVGKKTLPCRP